VIASVAARVVAAGLLVGAVSLGTSPANAAAPVAPTTIVPAAATTAGALPHIELTSISPYGALGDNIALGLRLTGPLTGLELRVTAFAAVTSRSAYERTIDGKGLGTVVGTETYDISTLPASSSDGELRTLTVGIQDPSAGRDATRFSLRKAGVFPLKVDLVPIAPGPTLDGFVTHLVVTTKTSAGTPTSIGEPLQVAWVWPIVAPSARQPDGTPNPTVVAQFRPDGRLGRIAAALPGASTLPLTLELGPETVQSWGQIAQGDATLQSGIRTITALAGGHDVLASPYVPLDIPALQAAGLGGEVATQLAAGTQVLDNVLNTDAVRTTSAESPLDDAALESLRTAGVEHLVLNEGALEEATSQIFTPAQPFALQSGDHRYSAVSSDAGLVGLLNGEGTAALRAQRLLAGLAVVAVEQPNARRGVALLMDPAWSPSSDLLKAVIGGLQNNPFLHPATVDQVIERVPAETSAGVPVVRRLAPVKPGRAPVTAVALTAARAELTAFQTLVGAGASQVQAAQHAQLVALSSQWRGASGRRDAQAQLDSVDQVVGAFANQIQIPTDRTFTLTARRDTIPLSFNNLSDQPIAVRVRLESDRLRFPNGADQQLLLLPGTTTVGKFTIETRTGGPGTVPLHLSVTSADGTLLLQSSTLNVRSTVVNGVGVFLTIAAGVFLALWWLLHFRRRRRTRKAPAPVPAPVHQPA
jgi:hypothetical protein